MTVLVTAASREGSTIEIAEAIADVLREHGLEVSVHSPTTTDDMSAYDAVVVGSAVYSGHWLESAVTFVRRHADELSSRPVWLFSSGPVGDPARGLVRKMAADPVELEELTVLSGARGHRMFAGRLLDGHGPSGLAARAFRLTGDWRDWPEIEEWASAIAATLTRNDWYRRVREEAR